MAFDNRSVAALLALDFAALELPEDEKECEFTMQRYLYVISSNDTFPMQFFLFQRHP